MPPATRVQVVDYSAEYADAFARLNKEWLEKYFSVEPIDHEILEDPQRRIIDTGGAILYCVDGGEAVGTVALKSSAPGVFELTKMAVTQSHQGRGLGRLLLRAAVERFTQMDGTRLYLESHSSLTRALRLYESAGFCHEPPPKPSEYQRADVYMVYRPD